MKNTPKNYDEIIKVADNIAVNVLADSTPEDLENQDITDLEEYNNLVDSGKNMEKDDIKSETIVVEHNKLTGEKTQVDLDEDIELTKEELSYLSKMSSVDSIGKYFEENSDINIKDVEVAATMARLLQRWLREGQFNPWKELPESIQNRLSSGIVSSGTPLNNTTKAMAAKAFMEELAQDYIMSQSTIDLEKITAEFVEAEHKLRSDIGMETVTMYLSILDILLNLDSNIDNIKAKIPDIDIEKLKAMSTGIKRAYFLEDFVVYCKTKLKIKPFEMQKPEKVYREFNRKYSTHKNTINNIGICPEILHTHGLELPVAHAIAIAFCKYVELYSPDSVEEHTFMYYFIKNIYYMESLAVNGNTHYMEVSDKERKEDYLKLYHHIKDNYTAIGEAIYDKIRFPKQSFL